MSAEGIIRLLEAQGGAGSRRQLQAAGFSRRTVEAMVRRRELVSVRRDAVVLAAALVDATPWARRTLVARAVGHSLAPAAGGARSVAVHALGHESAAVHAFSHRDAAVHAPSHRDAAGHALSHRDAAVHALSHESALMVHGLPYFGEDGLVHLVRTDGRRGRRDDTIWVHSAVDPSWVVVVDGIRVVRPVMAALQVAATHGAEAGLVALDGVLHEARLQDKAEFGRTDGPAAAATRRQIASALTLTWGPGTPAVELVARLSDGRSESAGESRSRWLVRLLGFGPATPQYPVCDGAVLVGLADLKLDRWPVLIEFDGTGKYTGPGTLLAEKDREDRLRALGYEVVRLRWADLARPHLVRQRILAAIARAEARAATTG